MDSAIATVVFCLYILFLHDGLLRNAIAFSTGGSFSYCMSHSGNELNFQMWPHSNVSNELINDNVTRIIR